MASTKFSSDYTINNYSTSVGENRVRDPANDVAGINATGSITLIASSTSNLDGKTFTITDHNGLQKVYIFDDDGDGDTGTVDGSNRVRVQVSGVDKDAYATQLKTAITGPTGHNGSITITGPGLSYTGDGKIIITQGGGASGNQTIQTTFVEGDGFHEISGFEDGQTGTVAYKDADVLPYTKTSITSQNIRGQTTTARYRTFIGEDK